MVILVTNSVTMRTIIKHIDCSHNKILDIVTHSALELLLDIVTHTWTTGRHSNSHLNLTHGDLELLVDQYNSHLPWT